MTKHTPGPWTSRGNTVYGSGSKVAEVPSRLTTPGATMFAEEVTANARLIAAAPDLLAALKQMRAEYSAFGHQSGETLTQTDTAIAKAEGA